MTVKKILVLTVVVPVVLGVLGVGGYYGSQALMQNDAANNKDLEKFGLPFFPTRPSPATPTQERRRTKRHLQKKHRGAWCNPGSRDLCR